MMKSDDLEVEEMSNKKIKVYHNTTEEIEPEALIKIVEDIEKKMSDDKKTIKEAEKNLEILGERLNKLNRVLPKAKLWAKENELKDKRRPKKTETVTQHQAL